MHAAVYLPLIPLMCEAHNSVAEPGNFLRGAGEYIFVLFLDLSPNVKEN